MEVFDLPYVTRPKQRSARIGALLGALALALAGAPAAQAACPTAPVSKAFSAFGDTADYSLVSNGAFEAGTTGWTLSNASTATGNESWKVRSSADSKSLAIKANGTAVSPTFCVGIEHPTFRFFARRTSGTWGVLNVKLRWKLASGTTNETVVTALSSGDTAWHASSRVALATVLPMWNSSQNASVQIVFDPEDFGGNWAIDDVYIDPYTRG
jgi:hypothetical protein